jgi:hypothetical protein
VSPPAPPSTAAELFPPIPLAAWRDTKETLHRFAQIVGKIRLAHSARRNHWWNVPFHLTGRGITTRPMGTTQLFAIDFDFVDHRLIVNASSGETTSFPLVGQSVASFYDRVVAALGGLGVEPDIAAVPFDLSDSTPFADDTAHATYDPAWAHRYWVVLGQVAQLLEAFAGRFSGKTSPVHHFWHTFDVAVTRFSDRVVDQPPEADPVTREAYSREVVSFGFWFGDDTFSEPAFYSYTAPEPAGLADDPLAPEAARWTESRGSHLAVLPYAAARELADPRQAVLDFWERAYQAGAGRAGWDVAGLASPDGITDAHLSPSE